MGGLFVEGAAFKEVFSDKHSEFVIGNVADQGPVCFFGLQALYEVRYGQHEVEDEGCAIQNQVHIAAVAGGASAQGQDGGARLVQEGSQEFVFFSPEEEFAFGAEDGGDVGLQFGSDIGIEVGKRHVEGLA